jgi:ech hydrogenase subunit E
MTYRIPVGPFHLALEEPYKIDLQCDGERVVGASLKVGFNFRAIEWLAERRNVTQGIALLERVCGICSNVHAMTYCMALERIAGLEVPPRARHVRVVIAELERLHSHLLWAGVAAHVMGFETLFMEVFRLRERVMDLLEATTGNRVNYAMNRIGGVNRDLADPGAVRAGVRALREEVSRTLVPVFTGDRTVLARCQGVGALSREAAIRYGVVGPVARASGIDVDLRRDSPYLAYAELPFSVPVCTGGDVLARVVVRALEILESCGLVEAAVDALPPGPLHLGDVYAVPAGEAVVRIEAPRGEVLYDVATDGSDTPSRVKIRTPSYANIPAVAAMVEGSELADVPLIQAAVDPCYSCTDR